ncbi:MAG: S8 family serine peptidase [Actinocatenispora sp.]
MRRKVGYLLSALALAGGLLLSPVEPAVAAPETDNCAPPGDWSRPVPWAQQILDPERIWPMADGTGQRIGVLDSGIDFAQPQLKGHVDPGVNVLGKGDAKGDDCSGHGTSVAGLMVAQHADGTGLQGLAPGATVVPIRVSQDGGDQNLSGEGGTAAADIAEGIDWALDHDLRVVNIAEVSYVDDKVLKAAVANAVKKGVTIVASVGDRGGENENLTPYPAGYPGVIGVGAVDENMTRKDDTGHGDFVDLMAPGTNLVSTQRGSGMNSLDGSGAATAFVSATVALVLQRHPDISPEQMTRQLMATAAPGGGGSGDEYYGYGVVDPYSAVTEQLAAASPSPLPAMGHDHKSDAQVAQEKYLSGRSRLAVVLAAVAGGLLALAVVIGAAIPQGRRRRWRVTQARRPREYPEDDLPSPPVELFESKD